MNEKSDDPTLDHTLEEIGDIGGWEYATCACGWRSPPCPSINEAGNAWAQHMLERHADMTMVVLSEVTNALQAHRLDMHEKSPRPCETCARSEKALKRAQQVLSFSPVEEESEMSEKSEAREIVKGLMHEAYKHGAMVYSDTAMDVDRNGEKFLEEVLAAAFEVNNKDSGNLAIRYKLGDLNEAIYALRSWWAAKEKA